MRSIRALLVSDRKHSHTKAERETRKEQCNTSFKLSINNLPIYRRFARLARLSLPFTKIMIQPKNSEQREEHKVV